MSKLQTGIWIQKFLPGKSGSLLWLITSLGGANLEAAERKDPCFLLASSVLGLVLSVPWSWEF